MAFYFYKIFSTFQNWTSWLSLSRFPSIFLTKTEGMVQKIKKCDNCSRNHHTGLPTLLQVHKDLLFLFYWYKTHWHPLKAFSEKNLSWSTPQQERVADDVQISTFCSKTRSYGWETKIGTFAMHLMTKQIYSSQTLMHFRGGNRADFYLKAWFVFYGVLFL